MIQESDCGVGVEGKVSPWGGGGGVCALISAEWLSLGCEVVVSLAGSSSTSWSFIFPPRHSFNASGNSRLQLQSIRNHVS